ncbi:phage integrase N-terminal SAM-like domain-containing protein [Microbulbifer sp. DLAB2-AA]|uniref:phage integrase N-terminal SAM-like domain-containing protein n=1 Tax=Microbulbifer sp. DLAB2-AA TaxID=3243394 RepID=UPI00403970F6
MRNRLPKHSTKFISNVRHQIREAGLAYRTEQAYVYWIKRFIHFYKLRYFCEVVIVEVETLLNYLSVNLHCSVNIFRKAANRMH